MSLVIGQYKSIILIILIWIISFVEPSGWAMMIHLPDKINYIIVALAIIFYLRTPENRMEISDKFVVCIVALLAVIPYFISGTWEGASYLVSFLTVYIVSQCNITSVTIRFSAWIIAVLGLVVLYIYTSGDLLSGWNENAVSMTGLFSYTYFTIFLNEVRSKKRFWFWNGVTLVYMTLLFQIDCRSGMLFSILAVTSIYFSSATRRFIGKRNTRLLLLNIPLIISLIVIAIASSRYFEELDTWSMGNYHKTIFNGRDILWDKAFTLFINSDFLGTGKFMINYHNSGVATLSVFGILGYICWIKFFSKQLSNLNKYISDKIVFGCTLAFLIIFLQQSVDLGFISAYPNLLPYMILGIGLARVRMIKENDTITVW